MTPWLKSVEIDNFRSVRGSITVPLEASIVLLHGPNATGKTSVLSAIELALTGRLSALGRAEPDYQEHLLHRDSSSGGIRLMANELPQEVLTTTYFALSGGGARGTPLLGEKLPAHFNERCYLPQQSLGRLLELYQYSRDEGASPLSSFIRELLQLDQLESLIEGIQDVAGDVRRTRRRVPEYDDIEQLVERLDGKIRDQAKKLADFDVELVACDSSIREILALLEIPVGPTSDALDFVANFEDADESAQIEKLARQRLELSLLFESVRASDSTQDLEQHTEADSAASAAETSWQAWVAAHAEPLRELAMRATRMLGQEPPNDNSSPAAFTNLHEMTALARERSGATIARDDATAVQAVQLDEAIAKDEARATILSEEIAAAAFHLSGTAQMLLVVQAHVDGNTCPVCERDFSEVSPDSLSSAIAKRVAHLNQQGSNLERLTRENAALQSGLVRMRQQKATLHEARLSQQERVWHKLRFADLSAIEQELTAIRGTIAEGQVLSQNWHELKRAAEEIAQQRTGASDSRARLAMMLEPNFERALPTGDSLQLAVASVSDLLLQDEQSFARKLQLKHLARTSCTRMRDRRSQRNAAAEATSTWVRERATAASALENARARIIQARGLGEAARRVRAAIVGRVFNETLNALWRDLFVRLAPGEAFVPAFSVPDVAKGPVMARFETVHRDGGRGGTPGAMLSAGNLNTAALTLFLALHLSVEARLPCVLLDDPVQSMDEVHIAQFTALLRTLVREHDRQVVLAVHERPLFEYLALELSPVVPGERLVTVELGRDAAGDTTAEVSIQDWKADAVGAVSAA